jgi:hypothetical protein
MVPSNICPIYKIRGITIAVFLRVPASVAAEDENNLGKFIGVSSGNTKLNEIES